METELNNTVALGARRSPSAAPAHQSEPATGAAVATAAVVTSNSGSGNGKAPDAASGNGSAGEASASANLEQALQDLSGYVQNVQRNLQFDVDDASGHTVIRVVDSETDEVIRQIPSEEVLALARHLKSMGEGEQGLFLKEKA